MNNASEPLRRLRAAIADQHEYLGAYGQPSEPIAYEVLRALDDLFIRELMLPDERLEESERLRRQLSTWGINHALRRVIPRTTVSQPFRLFPSREGIQAQADDFVFSCGVLALAERFEGWLAEGVLTGELRRLPMLDDDGESDVLILKNAKESASDEEIGLAGLRWLGDKTIAHDAEVERDLERRFETLRPYFEKLVRLAHGWHITYTSTPEIDDYFLEWARFYLRRKFSQDMIGTDDQIGGRPFGRYTEVLSTLSGWAQKHLAFAAILVGRHHPFVHIRNVLTSFAHRDSLIESIADYLDADRNEIEAIVGCLTLHGANLDIHTTTAEPTWAPIVQASADNVLLPMYGLDINPYLFLLSELRARYEADWFRIANGRERRWIQELEQLFADANWQTNGRNARLRQDGMTVTDIDFALLDVKTKDLCLFQLKWQHPVGIDNRGRRSAGRNLITESNRWVASVLSWIERHGMDELARRLNFRSVTPRNVHLIVLGRYHTHLTGADARDPRAIWSDWAHFQKAHAAVVKGAPLGDIVSSVRGVVEQSRQTKKGEGLMFPIADLTVLVNPTSAPTA